MTKTQKDNQQRSGVDPVVTVITVVYNDLSNLLTTRESINAQSDKTFEWVVVDGGSTDGTVEAIQCLDHQPLNWISERDKGIYDAMNKGLKMAKGDYIVFLNSGDCLTPGAIEAVRNVLSRPESKDVDMILGSALYVFSNGHRLRKQVLPLQMRIHHSLPTSHQAMFIRRSLHLKHLHNLTYKVCSDYYTVASMSLEKPSCAYVDSVVSVVTLGGDSFSSSHRYTHLKECIWVQRRVLRLGLASVSVSTAKRFLSLFATLLLGWKVTSPFVYFFSKRSFGGDSRKMEVRDEL